MSRNDVNSSNALYPAMQEHAHPWSTSVEPGFLLTPLELPEKRDFLGDGKDVNVDFGLWLVEPYHSMDQNSVIQEAHHPSTHPLPSSPQLSEINESPFNGGSEVSKTPSDRFSPSDHVALGNTPPDEAYREDYRKLLVAKVKEIIANRPAPGTRGYRDMDLSFLDDNESKQVKIDRAQKLIDEQRASYAQLGQLTASAGTTNNASASMARSFEDPDIHDILAVVDSMQAGMDGDQGIHGNGWELDSPIDQERDRQFREAVASVASHGRRDNAFPESELVGKGSPLYVFDSRSQTLCRVGYQHSCMDSQYQPSSSTEYQHSGIDTQYQTPSGTEHQHSGMVSQYQTPSGVASYDAPAAYNSTPDVERMLGDRRGSWKDPDEYSDQDSPTLRKQRRRKAASHPLNDARLEQGGTSIQQHTGASYSSNYQLSPPVIAPQVPEANDDSTFDFRNRGFSAMCNGYVSQHYYCPSAESTIIMPRFEQPPDFIKNWLNHKIAKKKRGDATDGFNSPQVLRYEPLGDLDPQNEKHEATRCRLAAELIFDQDVTGQSDCYDHDMAGAYHFIPKSQTDKWNDDSNFFVTDKEFDEFVEGMDKDSESCSKLHNNNVPQVVEEDEMEYELTAPNLGQPVEDNRGELWNDSTHQVVEDVEMEHGFTTSILDPPAKETVSCTKADVPQDQDLPNQPPKQPEPPMEMEEQVLPNSPKQTESLAETGTVPKPVHPLTPTEERRRKAVRLDTTPTNSPMILEPLDSAGSPDSFKTAHGSPQITDLISGSKLLPIQSFHADRPSTPDRRASRSSKGRKPTYGSDKTTKNVFAVVEDRREQLEGQSSNASPTGSGNWEGTPPRLRPLEPSPLEGYGTGGPRYGAGGIIQSPGTPTHSGRRESRLSSSFGLAQQNPPSFIPQPIAPKPLPTIGMFYPKSNPNAQVQQPQPFSGNRQHGSPVSTHNFDMWGNRIGRGEHFGFSQPENRAAGQTSYPVANTPMQYSMQPPPQRHMEYHQAYTANMQMHHGPTSPGNRSSDSTISAASQLNTSPAFPRQGYQPETPSKNEKMRNQMPSSDGPSPSPLSAPGLPGQLSMNNPLSDPRTPRSFDSTPIKFNLPSSASKSAAREKAVITFRGHKECAKAQKVLEDAATASPEKRIVFTETFNDRPTTITLSAPAGNNIRGWVKTLLPYARVEISMT